MSIRSVSKSILLTAALTSVFLGSALSAATLGDKPTYQSDGNAAYALSPDKKAFTLIFSNVEVRANASKPVATHTYSIVLPVQGGAISSVLIIQGYVNTQAGAQGTLIFDVNGKITAEKFTSKLDKSFLTKIEYQAAAPSELRMTVVLIVERDPKAPNGGEGYLVVDAIDSDLALAKKNAAEFARKRTAKK